MYTHMDTQLCIMLSIYTCDLEGILTRSPGYKAVTWHWFSG